MFSVSPSHTFARNVLQSCLNARKSEGLYVAFDILVTLYERDDRNWVRLRHKAMDPYWKKKIGAASTFRHVSNQESSSSNSSSSLRFFFDKSFVCLFAGYRYNIYYTL